MAEDYPPPEPPKPKPRRRNTVLLLWDGPIYRDWAAWLTVFWAVFTAWAIATSPPSGQMPLWLETMLATALLTFLFGVVPAWVRLTVRRLLWKRRRNSQERPEWPLVSEPRGDGSLGQSRPRPAVPPSSVARPREVSGPVDPQAPPRRPIEVIGDQAPTGNGAPAGSGDSHEQSGNPVVREPSPPQDSLDEVPSRATSSTTRFRKVAQEGDDLYRARRELPYPAARAARVVSLTTNARDEYEAVLDAGEALALSVGLTAAAWARAEVPGCEALENLQSAYLQRGVTQGHWLDLVREIGRTSAGHPHALMGMDKALRLEKGGQGLLADLRIILEERNRWAHGAKPHNLAEAAFRVTDLRVPLERAMARSAFLAESSWVLIRGSSYRRRERNFRINAYRAMGDHPEFERFDFDSSIPLADDNFYILGSSGPIDLSPFVVTRFCETCRQAEVCYADRLDPKRGVSLKSIGRGHVIYDTGLQDEILHLAEGHRGHEAG